MNPDDMTAGEIVDAIAALLATDPDTATDEDVLDGVVSLLDAWRTRTE